MRMGRTTTTTRAQHGASHGASELVGWYVAKSPQSPLGFARSNRELTTALFIGRHSCWCANYRAGFFFGFIPPRGGWVRVGLILPACGELQAQEHKGCLKTGLVCWFAR